jgi:hypothetical protein
MIPPPITTTSGTPGAYPCGRLARMEGGDVAEWPKAAAC